MLLVILLLILKCSLAVQILGPGHIFSESTSELLALNTSIVTSESGLIAVRVTWVNEVAGSVGCLTGVPSVVWLECDVNEFGCGYLAFYTGTASVANEVLGRMRFRRDSALVNGTQAIAIHVYQPFNTSDVLSMGDASLVIPILTSRLPTEVTIGFLYYVMLGVSVAAWLCICFGCYVSCSQFRQVRNSYAKTAPAYT